MAKFEGQERRMPKIEAALKEYGMTSLEEARDLCLSKGIDVESIVKGVQSGCSNRTEKRHHQSSRSC